MHPGEMDKILIGTRPHSSRQTSFHAYNQPQSLKEAAFLRRKEEDSNNRDCSYIASLGVQILSLKAFLPDPEEFTPN